MEERSRSNRREILDTGAENKVVLSSNSGLKERKPSKGNTFLKPEGARQQPLRATYETFICMLCYIDVV